MTRRRTGTGWLAAAMIALAGLPACGQILGLGDPVDAAADLPDTHAASGDAEVADGGSVVDGRAAPGDALSSDASAEASDAADAERACNPAEAFGAPTLVPGSHLNTSADEGMPRLSPNELALYFWSDRTDGGGGGGPTHLYAATRTSKIDAFGDPVLLANVNSSADEASPTVSADGTTLVFESDRLGGSNGQLFVATRGSLTESFGPAAPLANVNSASDQATPYLRPDVQVLYFSSNRGSGGEDLYQAALQSNGSFASPTPVAELNSAAQEYSPCVADDDLTIFWGSTRTDLKNYGDFDIYVASRARALDGFASPANAGAALNSSALDLPGWISADGCSLYLESTRGGTRDIYVARRPPP